MFEPLSTRTQVKKQLANDNNIDKKTKKILLGLWDYKLIYVYPNETIMLTEKGAELGKQLSEQQEIKGGYSDQIIEMFKQIFTTMEK